MEAPLCSIRMSPPATPGASVPCHHIREYRYAYGAVEPVTGEHFFPVLPRCDTICMNVFLKELSKTYPEDQILLVCDGASWHRSKGLKIPGNITLLHMPPYTPEMNPIEQIWKQLRAMGFRNEVFKTLNHVVDRLCETICRLSHDLVKASPVDSGLNVAILIESANKKSRPK